MRALKYRAWDTQYQRMYSWEELERDDVILLFDLLNGKTPLVPMQFTGLKDKNGKEIYESDRIETPAGIVMVKWDRCFCLFWNDGGFTTLHDFRADKLEVIGNIYEI